MQVKFVMGKRKVNKAGRKFQSKKTAILERAIRKVTFELRFDRDDEMRYEAI